MTPISFLKRVHPDRPWVLTAIEPSQKGIETRAFLPGQEAEAEAWIAENNGRRNLYWSVAEVLEPENKKAERENVKAVHWLHVDIDAGPGDLVEELKRIKKLVTTNLPTGVPKPTIVLFSGGGYQAFWQLDEPIPIHGNIEAANEAARYNKQLELLFGGDSCHNVDRIMRLPGTMNIPNQRKIAKGRVPVEAEVVPGEGPIYNLADFTPAADVGRTEAGEVEISGNVPRLNIAQDIVTEHGCPDRVAVIIANGRDPDQPKEGDNSRSAWLFDAVCQMVRANVPDDVIYGVITDPGFKIAESVLEASNSDRYAKKQIKSAKEAVESEWLHRLNSEFAVIGDLGGRCLVVREVYDATMDRHRLVKQSFTDFRNRFMNQYEMVPNAKGELRPVPVGKWWLEHPRRRQYDRLVFEPGRDVPGVYNLWRGFGCNAIPGPNHESFLKHLQETICKGNEEHYGYLIRWLATAVQFPAQPGHVAVVMRGEKGTGKSFFAKHFGKLFGRHFLHVSNANHLLGQFNGHLRDAIVVFGDEAFYAGDKRHESVLKTLVTEESIMIETKGVDAEAFPNYTHLILASNSDWVVPAGKGERRYFVLDVDDFYARDTAHFASLARDLERGGYENLLHHLMHLDLSDFDVRSCPTTAALSEQKWETLRGSKPLEYTLGVMLDTCEVPCEIFLAGGHQCVYPPDLAEAVNRSARREVVDHWAVRRALKVLGCESKKTEKFNVWTLPSVLQGRTDWEEWAGQTMDWEGEIQPWFTRFRSLEETPPAR